MCFPYHYHHAIKAFFRIEFVRHIIKAVDYFKGTLTYMMEIQTYDGKSKPPQDLLSPPR